MSDDAGLYEALKDSHYYGVLGGVGAGTVGALVSIWLPELVRLSHRWSVFAGMCAMLVVAVVATLRFREGLAEGVILDD